MRHKVAVITWTDAWSDTNDFSKKKAKKMTGVLRHTVGWLVTENDEGIVLCADYYEKEKPEFNSEMFIPWGWVKKYWEYEL